MGNFEVVREKARWDEILHIFSDRDIYYQYEYARSLELHGDGEPLLFYFRGEKAELCYVVMKRDISVDRKFEGSLEKGKYYDLETPYGYGGPLVEGELAQGEEEEFLQKVGSYCREEGIIAQFIKFHPLSGNYRFLSTIGKTKRIKSTVSIDTSEEPLILINMDAKNRNMLRKAERNGVEIVFDRGDRINEFIEIYHATMRYHSADEYFFFKDVYYNYLIKNLSEQMIFLFAVYQGTPISAALFFYTERWMHYHLSGTIPEYRGLASMNLLLYQAALWANRRGIQILHLGGGISENDSLYGFKKQFNKRGALPFYVGGNIFDKGGYESLLAARCEREPGFNRENDFVLQYRK